MDMNDPKSIDDFNKLIREIVKQELKKARFNRMIPAIVTAVDGDTVDIKFLIDGSASTIADVKNRTGETLIVDDEVYVEFINNSSSNIYVAIKK